MDFALKGRKVRNAASDSGAKIIEVDKQVFHPGDW